MNFTHTFASFFRNRKQQPIRKPKRKMERTAQLRPETLEDRVTPTTIAAWTFENNAIAVNNSPTPSTGTGTASGLGMTNSYNSTTSTNTDDVVQGVAGDTGTNTLADTTQIWRVRGQSPGNGWSSMAPIGTQGAEFAESTVNYSGPITVSFDWYATNQGEANLQLEYTTNGGTTWTNVPLTVPGADTSIAAMTNSSSPNTVTGSYVQMSGGQQWAPNLTASISDPAAANNANFAIELVNASTGADCISASGGALNNSSGNWRFDNISISGTPQGVTPTTAAVPTFSPTTANYGQSVTFTDVVTASNGSLPPTAGSVTFMNGSTVLATATTDTTSGTQATFTVSSTSVPVGSYSTITAVYNPGTGFSGSTSSASAVTLTINGTATTTAAPTFNPTTTSVGSPVSFTAVVTASSGSAAPTAGSVTFMSGSTVLATATTETTSGTMATFTVSSSSIPVGSYSNITAVYAANGAFLGSTSAAAAATLTVNAVTAPIGTLAQWTFENDPNAVNNSPAPSTGVGTASAIGMTNSYNGTTSTNTDDVVQGSGSDTGANGLADLTHIWRVRGQSPGNGWSSMAPIGTQGAVYATSTVGHAGPINVSFDWYATTAGEANLQLEYTTDGTTWHNTPITIGGNSSLGLAALTNSSSPNTVIGSYISDNKLNNGSQAGQDWFQGLTASITDPAAANDPNFAIELVNASTGTDCVNTGGTALNNTSGNWRFDNVTIAAPQAYAPGDLVILQAGDGTTSYNTQAPLFLNEISTSAAADALVGITGTTADASGNVTVTTASFTINGATYTTYGTPGGTATVTTTNPNGFQVGDQVIVQGVGDNGYNGTFTITAVNAAANAFSYVDNNATAPAGFSFGGTASVQNFTVGEEVQISGVQVGSNINSAYNGVYTVASVNNAGSTFTYFDPLAAGLAAGTPAPTVAGATGGAFAYALVQQDAIPAVAGTGAQAGNQPVTIDLSSAAGNGQLNRSYDGSVLSFGGVDSTVNNGGLTAPTTPTGSDNRVEAVIGGNPGVALSSGQSNTPNNNPTATPFYNSTTDGAYYVGDDNRGAIADGPTGPLYSAGHPNQAGGAVSQGVHEFATEGPNIGTQVSATTNVRGVTIGFDNRMYLSTAGGLGGAAALNTAGIFTEAQALPTGGTVPANDIMVVPALFGASKLGGVYLADVNGDGIVDNGDKLYFVDDGTVGHVGTGGIYVATWNDLTSYNPWNTPNNAAAAAAGFVDHWSVPVRVGDAPIQNGAGNVGQLRGITGTVLGNGTVDIYTTAYDNSAQDNSIIQQWIDPNSGAAITSATEAGSTVTLTFNVNINPAMNGQLAEIDGVTSPAGTQGAAALSQGYNGAFVVSTVVGHPNQLTYTDSNSGLTEIDNAGAADIVLNGTIIAEANAGSITLKNSGDIGLRGVAFAPVAATSVTLSQSPANPLAPGTAVNLTAMVSNPETGVNVNGDVVTFVDDNTNAVLGQATVVSGQAVLALPSGVIGDHYVHAYFAGGGLQALASAKSNEIQIIEAGDIDDSVQLVTSCPVGAGVGSPVTFTATVSHPASPALGASDTVSFYNGSVSTANLLGTTPVNSGTGVTTLTTAFSAIATDTIIAVFNGDNNYESSQASVTQKIGANATGTISSSANNVALNATPTYTATVVGNATVGAPTGTVTFQLVSATTGAVVGTSPITLTGSGNSRSATWTSPALASPGSYFVTFTYTPGAGIQYNGFTIDTISSTSGTALVETVKQAFTPGNLVAVQRGDGNINLGSSGYLVFLDEYQTNGTLVQRIALPNLDAGTAHALLLGGQNGNEGLLNRSANGAYLTVEGYDVPVGHTFLTSTFPYQFTRTVALESGAGGTPDTSTSTGIANPNGSGVPAAISSASASGTGTGNTVTITLSAANYFLPGQSVTISGVSDSAYDGTFTIVSVASNNKSFTFTDPNSITTTTPTVSSALASSPASVPYNPSDVVSVDGTQIYEGSSLATGDTTDSGILYVGTVGSSTASEVGPVGTASVSLAIIGGQLYSMTGGGHLSTIGSGEPTSIDQSATPVPSFFQNYNLLFPGKENAEQVLALNTTDGSTINPNVIYVADQANGILKFTLFSASNVSLTDPGTGTVTSTYTGAALVPGEYVNIANASDPTFDGTFQITSASAGTFTFSRGGSAAGSATGATATEWVYGDSTGTGTFGQKLIFAGGATAITGYVVNPGPSAQVQLYVTGVNVTQANPNQLDSWLDTNGGTAGFTSGNVTNLAFVGGTPTSNPASPNGNENFAGLAFAPGYPTSTAVAVTGNSGTGYSVTATVTDPTGGGNVPTGAVYFYLDGSSTPYGSEPLNGSGVATLPIAGGVLTGEHSFTAAYQGDVKDDQSTGVSGQAFGVGNLIATVGTTGSNANATATSVSEFQTTGGTAVQTIYLPTMGTGELTLKGNATTEGYVSDSADGHSASFGGYVVDAGSSTTGAAEAIAQLAANGSVNTSTQIAGADTGSSVRATISADGLGFWVAGNNYLRYVPFGNSASTASTEVSNYYPGPGTVEIQSGSATGNPTLPGGSVGTPGALYMTGAAGSPGGGLSSIDGPAEVLGGLGTVPGQVESTLGTGSGSDFNTGRDGAGNFPSTNQIAVSPDGLNIFVADSRTDASGGILWYYDIGGGNWTLLGHAQVPTGPAADTGLAGLVADFSGVISGSGPVTLYATTSGTSANRIVQITGFTLSGTPSFGTPTFSTVETAAAGTAFRGVAFAPKAAAAAASTTTETVTTNGGGFYADSTNNVTLSATVTGGSGTATGYVSFQTAAGVEIGSAPLVGGTATLKPVSNLLVAQSGAITAVYTGDSVYAGSTSASQTATVAKETTTTTVTPQFTSVTSSTSDTLTAQVTFTGSNAIPTGTVTFWKGSIGGTQIGSPVNLTATIVSGALEFLATTSTTFSAGTTVYAVYNGDSNFATSPSAGSAITVSLSPTVTVTTTNANPGNTGASVTETVTVTGSGATPTGYVQFYDNLVPIGSPVMLVGGTASVTVTTSATQGADGSGNQFLLPGTQSITAVYSGDSTYFSGSGVYQQAVQSNAFGAGDKFVYRVGDGINTLFPPAGSSVSGSIGSTIYIDEINPGTGLVVQSIILPTNDGTGTQASIHAIVGNGQQSTTEQLTVDGANSAIWLTGYDTNPLLGVTVSTGGTTSGAGTLAPGIPTAAGSSSTGTAIVRAIARVTTAGVVQDETFTYKNSGSGFGNFNSVYSPDGNSFYLAGNGGVTYFASFSPSSGTVSPTATINTSSQTGTANALEPDGSNLALVGPSGTFGVDGPQVFSGFPTSSQTSTSLPGFSDAAATAGGQASTFYVDAYFTHLDNAGHTAPAGINTMYLSDDGPSFAQGAITKWSLVSGVWTVTDHIVANGSAPNPISYYYISGQTLSEGAGSSAVGNVTLFVTYGNGGNADAGPGQLFSITDNSGYDAVGLTAGANINQTSSSSKETYRGVAAFTSTDLTGAATPVSATEGTAATNVQVATFTDPDDTVTPEATSTYSATITWGDGTSSAGTITYVSTDGSGSHYTVSGTHTYAEDTAVAFPVSVSINDQSYSANLIVSTTATVADAGPSFNDITVTATAPTGVQEESSFTQQVATFTDPIDFGGSPDPATGYTATIMWGDGTSSAGTITLTNAGAIWPASGIYTVTGTHTYAEDTAAGFGYPMKVIVSSTESDDQNAMSASTPVTVADSGGSNDITGAGSSLSETAGVAFGPVQVAQFTDQLTYGGTVDPVGTYSASIDWGDGTGTSTGTITFVSSNTVAGTAWTETYSVAGSHTYATSTGSPFTITVTILGDDAGTPATVTGSATVASAAPPPSISNVVINQDLSALFNANGGAGGVERSMVDDIVYTFSEAVNIVAPGTDPNVFTIAVAPGWTGTVPTLSWAPVAGSGNTQWAITFSGAGVSGNSIANGAYTITVNHPAEITAVSDSQALSLTGSGIGSATQSFYRLFGDINGDEVVNALDNARFKTALTTYNAAFDFNNDGVVNALDNARFKNDLTVNFTGFTHTI